MQENKETKPEETLHTPQEWRLNTFIGWSGDLGKKIAKELRQWLPKVFPPADPFMSEYDIDKGLDWYTELDAHLQSADFGIFCITPENTTSQWIHFEAGALAYKVGKARIAPFLMGVDAKQMGGPLSKFQFSSYDKESDVLGLVSSMNKAKGSPLIASEQLETIFRKWLPELKEKLDPILEKAKGLPPDQHVHLEEDETKTFDSDRQDYLFDKMNYVLSKLDRLENSVYHGVPADHGMVCSDPRTRHSVNSVSMMNDSNTVGAFPASGEVNAGLAGGFDGYPVGKRIQTIITEPCTCGSGRPYMNCCGSLA